MSDLISMLAGAAGSQGGTPPGPTTDPYFSQVSLLLHGDGTNGATNGTFLDTTGNYTLTGQNAPTQGSFSPFPVISESYSVEFNAASSDRVLVPDGASIEPGASDFTIECWIYPFTLSNAAIAQKRTSTSVYGGYNTGIGTNGEVSFVCDSNTSSPWSLVLISSNGVVSTNTWHHCAFTRSGSTWTIWVDGVSVASTTASFTVNDNSSALGIGATSGGTGAFDGLISNFRMVIGTAVYTSAFTPPTSPLTAISGTAVLTCQSSGIIDNGPNSLALTTGGTPTVSTSTPFNLPGTLQAYDPAVNGGSGYFDGAEWISMSSDVTLSGDFTIETWVNPTAVDASGYTNFMSRSSTNHQVQGVHSTYAIGLVINSASVVPGAGSPLNFNTWTHLAWVREGTTCRTYVNGVQAGAGTGSGTLALNKINQYRSGGYELNGWQSDLRVLNGTCLYPGGTTFTPPTSPLTAITNTALLLNFTNAGIFDNSGRNTFYTDGGVSISTSVKKFGTGSISFNGTTGNLYFPVNPALTFGTGDFTIEFWMNTNVVSGSKSIYDPRTTSSQAVPVIFTNASQIALYVSGSTRITGGTISIGTWHHVALARSGTSTKLFLDGTQVGSTFSDGTNYIETPLAIGIYKPTNASAYNGYLDDLRVTKGVARYTANFTPPTEAFPNQ